MQQLGRAAGLVSPLLLLATFCSLPLQTHSNTLYEDDACKLRDGASGVCTKSVDCPWFIETILKKSRFNEAVRCSFVDNIEVVCCKRNWIPGDLKNEPTTEPATEPPTELSTEPPIRTSRQACEQYDYETQSYNIIGGYEAADIEFPFMAVLGYLVNRTVLYQCGASLISASFLLTAAHCKRSNGPTTALLGTINIADGNDGIQIGVKKFIAHPQYRRSSTYHDIALVELMEPVEFNVLVMPICLHDDPQDLPEDKLLSAEGFGIVDVDRQIKSSLLMKVNLTTVPWLKCNQSFADANLLKNNRKLPQGIVETQYCATGTENNVTKMVGDTCQGDSGGPLQVLVDKKYRLVGVTSFGNGCGSNTPSVSTRVAAYIDWIESIVWA
uniref:Putative clip-domain serine protease subfamily protein c n=1 Tax=Anopheles marajoara TaxID=58244 RepID=A0A2M4BRE9_9DIPT